MLPFFSLFGFCLCTITTVKVTPKKGKAKSLKATITVKNPTLTVKAAATELAVGETTTITAKATPKKTVSFKSSDETIATVDATGAVKAVKAGTVKITATAGKLSKDVDLTIKKVIFKEAKQSEVKQIVVTVAGDAKDLKAGDFKVTNTATNGTVAVKSAALDKKDATKLVINTFTEMKDAKEYTVVYADTSAKFTATDGTPAKVGLDATQIPAGTKTEVRATLLDANGVILSRTDLDNGDSSKGKVTSAVTLTKGYQDGTNLYLPAVGDTATVKVTYHTGTFGTDGKETGLLEDTFTVTAVDPSLVNYNFAVTVSDSAPAWDAISFKANTNVKMGADRNAYIRITDDKGKNVTDKYSDYTVESADKTKLVVASRPLVGENDAVLVRGVAEGNAYILVKKDDKVVATLPVTVVGKPVATTLDLSTTSVTVITGGTVTETVNVIVKDQYGDKMTTGGVNYTPSSVSVLAAPEKAKTTTKDTVSPANTTLGAGTISINGNTFANDSDDVGSYTLKVTVKVDNKELTRSLNVNVVKSAAKAQSYALRIDTPEVDTTLNASNAGTVADNAAINLSVVKLANGGAIDTMHKAIYTIKNAKGDVIAHVGENITAAAAGQIGTVVSSPAVYADKDTPGQGGYTAYSSGASGEGTLKIRPYNVDSSTTAHKITKNLPAGTYTVQAKVYGDDNKVVTVNGSFTIKDTQDTRVSFKILDNKFGTDTIATGFANPNKVEVYYDGIKQTNSNLSVSNVKGVTVTGGGAYIKTLDLYVNISGSDHFVKLTLNVNDQIATCASAGITE